MTITTSDSYSATTTGERQRLALPIELEEGAPSVLFQSAMTMLSGLVVFLLCWANVAQIREVSMAAGEITPSIPIRQVAHLEGGIVEAVNVENGDLVNEGDALLRLRRESADDNFARHTARQAELNVRIERLAAQVDGLKPDFSLFEAAWPSLVAEQQDIYESSTAQHQSTIASLVARESSAQAELGGAVKNMAEARNQLKFSEEQVKIQNQLIDDGFTSKQAFIESKLSLSAARTDLANAEARLEKAKREFDSASADIQRVSAEYKNTSTEQRSKAKAELLELEQSLLISEDRDNRLTVRAPVSGFINGLSVNGAGDLVRPGETIAEIIPNGAEMIAEVRLKTKDIGHVQIGQDAEVTFTTFDSKKHGTLTGTIYHISADVFIDERSGEAYYQAKIEFEAKTSKERNLLSKTTSGMEVQVRIVTQSRTLMAYLLKPVVRSVDGAFSER